MTFNTGDFVQLEKGEEGQIWAVSGEVVFVCVPDNTARKARIYLKEDLEKLSPDALALTPTPDENIIKEVDKLKE